jgi:hypothetical protein
VIRAIIFMMLDDSDVGMKLQSFHLLIHLGIYSCIIFGVVIVHTVDDRCSNVGLDLGFMGVYILSTSICGAIIMFMNLYIMKFLTYLPCAVILLYSLRVIKTGGESSTTKRLLTFITVISSYITIVLIYTLTGIYALVFKELFLYLCIMHIHILCTYKTTPKEPEATNVDTVTVQA